MLPRYFQSSGERPPALSDKPGAFRGADPTMRLVRCLVLLAAMSGPAAAQMVLPGAVAPTPAGAAVPPTSVGRPAAKLRRRPIGTEAVPAPAKLTPPTALAGQTLFLNGRRSQVAFDLRDKALAVTRLSLSGEQLSNARETCQVEAPGAPFATTDLGHPDGVARVAIAFPACPIVFDVLDGAALATGEPASCEFKEANCRVKPGGLWGPQASALGPDKAKGIEHDRAQADSGVRANFKRLLTTTKDKPTIVGYAREQAGFSSVREETCRDYAGEDKHGFCASRLTAARAATLRAKADAGAVEKQSRKTARQKG